MAKPAPRTRREAAAERVPPTEEQLLQWRKRRRLILHIAGAVLMVGIIGWAIGTARQAVARRSVGDRPRVVLVNPPGWMSEKVVAQLIESFRPEAAQSVFDRQVLEDVHARVKSVPWVESVRSVRRSFGLMAGDTIEVDCEFRTPLALVREPGTDFYWYVDARGILLPERFDRTELPTVAFANNAVSFRVIDGVRNPPPAQPGRLWPGDDLLAGLDMAARLRGVPYAEEITRIDVSNYRDRVDPRSAQIVLVTKYGTQVRWGRPWIAADAFVEVLPERKLDTLRALVEKFGRVDANYQWVDIRFDGGYRSPDHRAGYMTPERRTMEASTRTTGDGN